MNLDKLKESARKYEQSGQWRPAIDVYKKALREFEESGEGMLDPSLYNRIGDLEMKDNEAGAAIRAYEQAADLYTEQGFFNNAIALCGKILRINAARTSTYLRLAQLNARKNFVSDAKKNLVEYLERMDALHHREEALSAIRAFAAQFSGNPDIRVMLLELLRGNTRGDESTESLDRLADELEAGGDATASRRAPDRIVSRDGHGSESGLVFLDVGHGVGQDQTGTIGDDLIDGLDLDRPDEDSEDTWRRDTSAIEGIDLVDPALVDDEADTAMPQIIVDGETIGFAEQHDIEPMDVDEFADADGGRSIDGFDLVDSRLDARAAGLPPDGPPIAQTYDTLDDAARAAPVPPEIPNLTFLDVDDGSSAGVAPETDPASQARDRAHVLLEVGDRAGAVAALESALDGFEAFGRFDDALQAAHELTRLEPDAVFRFQKRVELAYRSGRRDVMLDAYLQLGDALQRSGGVEHALTVYRRVLEHDADNAEARGAIARLSEPEPPSTSFVDLGSLILDEPQARDTRIRVGQAAPIEDEDKAFHEALEQFKRGIDENIDAEDFQAHYDLGIAFKEMGLLDEAIAQFQKALRSPEGRLKTSEQLGISFYDKGRFAIAEAVLRRAIDSLLGGDEDKIGLIYWLGRAVEAQRRHEEAVRCFERVLAVDIRFLDVGDRVHRLTTEPQ